jgi:hypothetical protein
MVAIRTAPGFRLRPPPDRHSAVGWLAVDLATGVEHLVSDLDAVTVVAFGDPAEPRDRAPEIAGGCGVALSSVEASIAAMRARGLLVPVDEPQAVRTWEVMAAWYGKGWSAAFDYHLASGHQTGPPTAVAGTPDAAMARLLPREVAEVVYGDCRPHRVTAEDLRVLLAHGLAAAGPGCPVRAYVLACDVRDLPPATYRDDDGALVTVNDLPDAAWRRAVLDGPLRAPFEPAAFLVLTASWSAARARVTDQRGYQDAFTTAGLVAAAIDLAGRARSVPVFWQHGTDDRSLHDLIGVDGSGLAEGVLIGGAAGRISA